MMRAALFQRASVLAAGIILMSALAPSSARAQAPPDNGSKALKRMSLEELSALEVFSVSREREPYGQAPAAIHVITHEDIRRSGVTSVAEALRLADNLIVARKNSHDWAITSRGFNTDLANKLLVLIDGRTVYTPLFSGVFWDRQDYLLEDIDRIEVISGPGGTLWGANAVNGVINIITRSARDSRGFYLEGGGGPQVNGLAGVRYGAELGSKGFVRLYGRYIGRDDEFLPDGRRSSDSSRMGQSGFRIDTTLSERDTLSVQGDIYFGREQVATGGTAETGGGNMLSRWSHTLSEQSDFVLQIYYDRTGLTDPIPALLLGGLAAAPAGILKDDLDTFDVDFQHRFRLSGRQRVTWGAGIRATHDVVENAPGLGFDPSTLNQTLVNAFVQDELTLSPSTALIAGTKVEHNDYTGFEIEPSVRLRWNVAPKHMFWAAVSRAVRAPARVDRDERLSTPSLSPLIDNLLIGGRDFVSETLVAYEAGVRGQVTPVLSTSVSAFYNRYNDLRSTSLSAPNPVTHLPFPLFFENNLEGHTYGVELGADHQTLPWWRLHGSYTFLSEHIQVEPGKSDFNNALNETADPAHQVMLRSSMDLPRRVEVDAAVRWISSFHFNNVGVPDTVPSYAELDARLAWLPVPYLELSLVGQNLAHDQHLEYVISSPNPREEIGRSVYAKAAVRW